MILFLFFNNKPKQISSCHFSYFGKAQSAIVLFSILIFFCMMILSFDDEEKCISQKINFSEKPEISIFFTNNGRAPPNRDRQEAEMSQFVVVENQPPASQF